MIDSLGVGGNWDSAQRQRVKVMLAEERERWMYVGLLAGKVERIWAIAEARTIK